VGAVEDPVPPVAVGYQIKLWPERGMAFRALAVCPTQRESGLVVGAGGLG